MAESYSFHAKALSRIPGSFLFQEKYLKQNFNLKAIFVENPFNSQFCGLTILKTFAPQKTVFIDFPDNAWELSLLTTITMNFHMDTNFTWHLGT